MNRMRWVTRSLAAVLLVASLAYVLTQFDWPGIGHALRQADWPWILGPGTLSILAYWWLRAWRWKCLLEALGISIPMRELYRCTALSLSLAIITPMQSGEALKVELLKRRGVLDRLPGYSTFFVERIADLAVIVALSLLAVAIGIIPLLPDYSMTALLTCTAIMAVTTLGLWALRPVRRRMLIAFGQIRGCVPNLRSLGVLLGLTTLGWIAVVLGWQASVRAVGIELGMLPAIALTAGVTLVNVLSLVPGAIGVSEFSAALLLSQWGIDSPIAQAGAIMLRVYALLIMAVGVLHLIAYRIGQSSNRRITSDSA